METILLTPDGGHTVAIAVIKVEVVPEFVTDVVLGQVALPVEAEVFSLTGTAGASTAVGATGTPDTVLLADRAGGGESGGVVSR